MQVINKIILGTAQFGLEYGINNTSGKPSIDSVFEILETAYDLGVRTLDTAEAYGDAHDIIGEFHRKNPLKLFNIITKLPASISSLDDKIDSYCKQLHVSKLKAVLFHSFNTYRENRSAIDSLHSFRLKGKVEYLGVSVYTNDQIEDVIGDCRIDIIQLPFNLFDNNFQRGDILQKAKMKGKILHSRSVFLQGLFFSSLQNDHKVVAGLQRELAYINRLSKLSDISLGTMALSYCVGQGTLDSVLVGVDNLSQLRKNLQDASYVLPIDIIEKIDNIKVKDVDLLNPSLWNR